MGAFGRSDMRLWHEDLIVRLPRQQLLGQHRECCALRGKGWAKKHEIVNYVFTYSPYKLFQYHQVIMEEMMRRGYQVSTEWFDPKYRGKNSVPYQELECCDRTVPVYPEHDKSYLDECLKNLAGKDIIILEES